MNLATTTLSALLIALLLTVAACGHEDAKPAAMPTTAATPVPLSGTLALSPASPGKTNSNIFLSDQVRKACALTAIESVKEAPKFDFDQSAITPEDRDVLAQVATCLTTGPLKGRSVKLVGRADPRGTTEYNMALGEHRANGVMRYLAGLGVGAAQMSETSRGALDASGSNEATWHQDRRVDVDVAEGK